MKRYGFILRVKIQRAHVKMRRNGGKKLSVIKSFRGKNKLEQCMKYFGFKTYLRSPSTSGRSLVMAITSANKVTNVVIKATGELQEKTWARN